MEILLTGRAAIPSFKPGNILELCLCLRQLKEIDIIGHKVSIVDSGTRRTITIDKRPYTFSKYTHPFVVADQKALEDRGSGTRTISPNQQIVCYVPEKSTTTDYPLYSGLPTKHRIKIPMAIDAPFELTTSREQIEEGCASWNDIVRKEMYDAIIEVIHARKEGDRANVLRFARFRYQLSGNSRIYANELSDLRYLNSYNYLDRLRSERILPTFDKKMFASISEKTAYKYPEAAIILLNKLASSEYDSLRPESIIDTRLEGFSKEQKDRIDGVLKALDCKEAPFSAVLPLLQKYAEPFIEIEEFRNCLYEYLQDAPADFREKIRGLKIIPIYGKNGGTQYVSWVDDGIFVKKDTYISNKSYWVLNETLLPKATCEKMLKVNINEMNSEWARSRYRDNLEKEIKDMNLTDKYNHLIKEFTSGALRENSCLGTLRQSMEPIPLKNELGEIVDTEIFLCDQPSGYFATKMLQRITVHKECAGFAEYIQRKSLSDIHYENVDYHESLTADDIEALQDDYFKHGEEILRGFYRDGYLSDELLAEYELEYLGMRLSNDSYPDYTFPEKPIRDRKQLIQHVKAVLKNPVTIFPVKIERSILKGRRGNGAIFELDGNDARNSTLQIYTPEGAKKIAFCQMCLKPKPYMLMEVNNLELKPKYYFHQTRVAFCLECSKRFEALREKENIREEYLKAIRSSNIEDEGKVEIPIGHEDTLTFTATHLAEIQEILKNMPK